MNIENRFEMQERFRAVILGEGYSEAFAERTIKEYCVEYMKDPVQFDKMLTEYETDQRGDQ